MLYVLSSLPSSVEKKKQNYKATATGGFKLIRHGKKGYILREKMTHTTKEWVLLASHVRA